MKTTEATSDPSESVSVTIVTDNSNNTTTPPPASEPAAPSSPPPKKDQNTENDIPKSSKIKRALFPIRILTFLLSLPILAAVIWLLYVGSYNCEGLIKLPKIQTGTVVGLLVVFVLSSLVAYFGARFPIPGLFMAMVPLIVMLIMGLSLIGAFRSESTTTPGSPLWIKMKVINEYNWDNIKSCIYQSKTCDDLITRSYSLKSYDLTETKLTHVEYGCCKPPSSCGMEYVNATYWKDGVTKNSGPYEKDCSMWENEEISMCYHCYSCKLGFLRTLQGKWWKLGVFLVVMSLLLIVAHLMLFVFSMWESSLGDPS